MPISLRSLFFFFFWFVWTGGANILPQVYFIEADPAHKESWISLLLVLGSSISVVGFLSGRSTALPGASKPLPLLALFGIVAAAFLTLFFPVPLPVYFGAYLVFRLVSCFIYQRMDQLLLQISKGHQIAAHSRFGVFYMLLGIMVGPLFFAYAHNNLPLVLLSILALTGLSVLPAKSELRGATILPRDPSSGTLHKANKLFLAYGAAYLSVIYLTSSLLLYFLADYYKLENPTTSAAWVMVATSGTAFFASVLYSRRPQITRDLQRWEINTLIILLQGLGISLLFLKLSSTLPYILLSCSIMGASYGIYMVLSRHYASVMERENNNGLLAVYNVLPYVATIAAFGICGLLGVASKHLGWSFYTSIGVFLALLLVAAQILSLALQGALTQTPRASHSSSPPVSKNPDDTP